MSLFVCTFCHLWFYGYCYIRRKSLLQSWCCWAGCVLLWWRGWLMRVACRAHVFSENSTWAIQRAALVPRLCAVRHGLFLPYIPAWGTHWHQRKLEQERDVMDINWGWVIAIVIINWKETDLTCYVKLEGKVEIWMKWKPTSKWWEQLCNWYHAMHLSIIWYINILCCYQM